MTQNDAYQTLAERLGKPDSVLFRCILEHLMPPLQAQLAVELPATPEELGQRFGLDVTAVNKELDDMYYKGLLFPRNFQTREGYRFARSVMQLHDATLTHLYVKPEDQLELCQLWQDFLDKEYYRELSQWYSELERSQMRVIPAYRAFKDTSVLQPYEDIRELMKAQQAFALVGCSCRKRYLATRSECDRHTYESEPNRPMYQVGCLLFDRGAEYAASRGSGKSLSYEEAMEEIDVAEEDGLIHRWPNSRVMTTSVLCNCCFDCCIGVVPLLRDGVPILQRWAKSRFQATIDPELCTGCQICVDRCQFDAIEMQKPAGSKIYKAVVDPEKCWGCGVCVIKCQPEALSMNLVRPPEHVPEA